MWRLLKQSLRFGRKIKNNLISLLDNRKVEEHIEVINIDEVRDNLKKFRLDKSKEENIKAYMIFNNETMEEIINLIPKNIDELQNIKGFGPIKIGKYGDDIINIIHKI